MKRFAFLAGAVIFVVLAWTGGWFFVAAQMRGQLDALAASGVPAVDLPATDKTTFDVLERITMPVDDQTPRIVPASFSGGQRPQGVVDITYVIDLSDTADRALEDDEYKAVTVTVAAGPTA